ncbi:hypothetical protein Csa_023846, partial [Cucumis sativus]
RNLSHSVCTNLALLLFMSDFIVDFVENRDFSTVESSQRKFRYRRNLTHFGPKQLGSPTFCDSLALLLSASDCIVALVENREFPRDIQIPKELDALWSEAAWLSYFLRLIELLLHLRIKSSKANSDTEGT